MLKMDIIQTSVIKAKILLSFIVLASSQEAKLNYSYDISESSSLEQGVELSSFEFDLTGSVRHQFATNFLLSRGVETVVCSPVAAMINLAQLAMGAEGVGQTELLNAIGVRKSQVKPKFRNLVTILEDSRLNITVKSKIFITLKVSMRGKFEKDMILVFNSQVYPLHFDQPVYTLKRINAWIEKEINLLASLDIDFKALVGRESSIVINIATVNGNWSKPFRNIGMQTFHSPSGSISLPMICRQGQYNYYRSDVLKAQILELPFKETNATFVAVLPYLKIDLAKLLKHLKKTPQLLNDAMKNMTKIKIIVTLPKFSILTNADIKSVYKSIGLNRIFQGNSGLSKIIFNKQMIVQLAWQVTFFNINENGTETTGLPATLLYLIVLILPTNCGFNLQISSEETPYIKEKLSSDAFDLRGTIRLWFALEFFLSQNVQNMACSPLSAMIPLAKLALGAEGGTQNELLAAIGMKKSQIKSEMKHSIEMLELMPGVNLRVGSRIFVSDKVELRTKFVKDTNKIFKSSVKQVDFDNPKNAEKQINSWIKKETEQARDVKIDYSITGPQSAIIISIITFVGDWENKFRQVVTRSFYSPKGVISVPMMARHGYYRYYKSDALNAQILEIPYEKKEASFVVILPYSKTGLKALMSKLKQSTNYLDEAMKKMTLDRVILSLPRFKIYSNRDIISVYKSVGVRQMFTTNSGLTKIIKNGQLAVNGAWQVTVIDVNENGTSAVAATGVDMIHISQHLDEVIFNADHPFLFYIKCDNEQVFAGTYAGN